MHILIHSGTETLLLKPLYLETQMEVFHHSAGCFHPNGRRQRLGDPLGPTHLLPQLLPAHEQGESAEPRGLGVAPPSRGGVHLLQASVAAAPVGADVRGPSCRPHLPAAQTWKSPTDSMSLV